MKDDLQKLRALIASFEAMYLGTEVVGELNLANPDTGDPSDSKLLFARGGPRGGPAGLYVQSTAGGPPTRLFDAVPVVQSRAAFWLPALAEQLDATLEMMQLELERGLAVLEPWLDARAADGKSEHELELERKRAACRHLSTRPTHAVVHADCIECGALVNLNTGKRVGR